ncbi:hypothetical protein RhiirA1_479125 [Rhizophagus irregularis]|uniref:Uncharacterized protein n=1 Tax=Rhizophagus irregularis TaxID=588596 RepID=A0A2I1FI71_9GLOM|nr:hypothetical protein RhiirA1_479125 [Rhizophagus irregularis]PKY34083.1 hypothetical protein RhiirB3_453492 [Rhizophagus irregularis]
MDKPNDQDLEQNKATWMLVLSESSTISLIVTIKLLFDDIEKSIYFFRFSKTFKSRALIQKRKTNRNEEAVLNEFNITSNTSYTNGQAERPKS